MLKSAPHSFAAMLVQSPLEYEFGRFRLIPSEQQLLRDNSRIALPPKVFDTLLLLVEGGGRLMGKEELVRQLWAGSFVDDASLARNISLLRKVLGAREDGGEFIETVPKRGYRFVAPVRHVSREAYVSTPQAGIALAEDLKAATSNESPHQTTQSGPIANGFAPAAVPSPAISKPGGKSSRSWIVPVAAIFLCAAAVAWWFDRNHQPRISRLQQITTSGRVDPWGRVVTDGSRIYFLERYADHWRAMQAPAAGGPTQPISWSVPGKNARVLDVSPDGSQFLAGSFEESEEKMPLWVVPTVGGPPVRVGGVSAYDAAWAPDGQHIVFSGDGVIFTISKSGDHQLELAKVAGIAEWFSWSPDARRLRFSLRDPATYRASLWEIESDGSGLHPVLQIQSGEAHWMGQWSPDGHYYAFTSTRGGRQNLWAIKKGHETEPLQLTAGPNSYVGGVFSRTGKAIFVPIADSKGDVVRYDPGTGRFFPFFSGARIMEMTFSRDGNWIVYGSGGLTRSRVDGTEQLLFAAGAAPGHSAHISPDGSQIVLTDARPNGALGISIGSMATGKLRPVFIEQLSRPDWAPDGKRIVCNSVAPIAPAHRKALYIGDLATERLTLVPSSEGLQGPRWSPDGRYLAALAWPDNGPRSVMLFDFSTGRWKQLATAVYPTVPEWSHDGRYLYYQDLLSDGEPIMRIAIATGKTERVVAFGSDYGNSFVRAAFLALGPGDRPIIDVTRNIADIYSLEVNLP